MTGKMLLLITLTAFCTTAQATEYHVSAFSSEGLGGWEAKSFKGTTEYSLVRDDGQTVVKAVSKGTASGLFKKVKLDPESFRYLRWSWKIAGTVKNGDETTKAGDDYAARVYVVFPGRFLWQTKAINYIWANRLARGEAIPNAFASHAMMLAVESGTERAGQWLTEERDILADYRRLFGGEPREIGAIAIMTDTDNTGGEATAWYGDITLSTAR
jgi:hypothetical protein